MDHGLPKVSNENDAVEKIDSVNNVDNTTGSKNKRKVFYSDLTNKRASRSLARQIRSFMAFMIEMEEQRKAEKEKIVNPPGFKLFKVLEFFCSKRTVEYVIEPMHAEYLVEYYEALSSGMKWKALYIKNKMNFFLVYGVVSSNLMSFVGKCIQAAIKSKTGK